MYKLIYKPQEKQDLRRDDKTKDEFHIVFKYTLYAL